MDECLHTSRSLVWVPVGAPGLSTRQLRYQCRDCFEYVGGSQRHALAASDTPEVDPASLVLRDEKREAQRARGRQLYDEWMAKPAQQDAEWWTRYDAHLASDRWQELRRLVFKRDNGICQGCYTAPATQVHHLTYKNVCDEFLWELVAVCDDCHDRYHGH
jgi:5-methylcytosine-specific restriction endonuclease McrA